MGDTEYICIICELPIEDTVPYVRDTEYIDSICVQYFDALARRNPLLTDRDIRKMTRKRVKKSRVGIPTARRTWG